MQQIVVHRIFNAPTVLSFWTIESAYCYSSLDERLSREMNDQKLINHYCMHEIDLELLCKGELDGNKDLKKINNLYNEIFRKTLDTENPKKKLVESFMLKILNEANRLLDSDY